MMGVAAMWSQLDAVVRTLKEHTTCKQNPRVNGLTQSSRVRRLIQDKKRQQQCEKLQKKRDLCKRTSAPTNYAAAARIDSEAEKEMEVTESDVSEGEEEPPEAGNCGVLTPPTDTETKGLTGRNRKIEEDYKPHSASDTQKTDFSGIRLEMGKEASINNSSLPSFTDCPDPSNTTSEENLIMEILQSPQPGPSQSSLYPPEMLDQTAQSQTSDKVTPSSDMDWSSGPPNNQSSSNPTARNIFESFPQFAGHPDSSVVKTLDLHEPPQHEQSDRTKSKEVNGVELESLPAKSVPTNNSQQLTARRDGAVSNEQQPGCQAVSSLSLSSASGVDSNCVTMVRSSPGPVLSLINSVRSPSVQHDLNQVRSPLSSENNVPCQSPQVKTINARGQEGPPASSPHPYTKLTDKVSVSGDIPNNRISVVHSPAQKAIFTNQPLSPLQVCVPKSVQQSPRLSSPNSGPLTPCNVQENRASVGSPNFFVGKSSKMSVSSPVPINSVQGAESASDSVLPIAYEQRSSKSEVKSPKLTSPLHVKEMETDQDKSSKNTQGTSSLPKCEKSQKKKGKSTSKKEKGKSSKVSSKSSEKQIDSDLVETFETSVTEDLGFPVISIKSVMKSPQEVSVSHKDKDARKVKDAECQQMSYKSFIRGVTGEECSTPVTERAGPRASPHTSRSSANSNEMLSEMIGLVSSLEKSQHKNSSSEKSSADFGKGKRNNSNTRKGKKIDDEANSSSPSKKLQWSPDLKALLKLVTPEKKGKSKGKKSKKAIASAEKRRNPSRKARRSNEENIRKDEPETDASPMSVPKNQSPLENTSKDIPNTVSDVPSKVVEMNTGALSMPSIHTFMSPVQAKSLESNSGPVIKEKKGNVSEEVGLTPKTVLTAVSALKDNGKNSRKSLSHPQNTGQGSIHTVAGTSAHQAENSQVLAEPLSGLETLNSVEINQAPSAVQEKKKEKVSSILETDYNKILYSPNRDFLDSPPRYESPGIAVSHGGHYQGNVSTTCNAQFDSSCEPIVYSSQIVTPSVYVLNESTSQHNSIVVSDSHLNVYSSGVGYIQNSVSYQEHAMNSGDQAVNYNTVYIDSNGIVQASSNSTGENIVPVSSTTPDTTPTPVTDILSAAAAVIHASPLQTVDSYQLNSTPETQSKDEQESVGQLLAYPVGRYYPEKKLHVRSLNFGPEAGTTEIRKPGYGRGHKKKIYDHIPSPVKPGGLVKKQAKGKAKSKGDIKGKAKTDSGSKEAASIQDSASKVVIQKQDSLTNPPSKMADEADDFIPDASGSVYILEGNTRKKIKLHKTPRSTKTVLPYFPNRYEMSQGIIPLRPELCKKSENSTPSPSLPVPGQSLVFDVKCELDKDSDSEVDVDGDCDLPDLSPEAPRKETPKSKCLEMVQQVDLTTPVKSSLSGNAGLYNTTKYLAQPSSVQSISDSCESFLDRQLTSAPKSVTFIEGTDSKESYSPSVRNFPSRPTSSFSNNSNSLPDLHSPSPLINMSTPPKKRITASLKHGGGCYFFSSSSQEGKSQAKVESKESEAPNSVPTVPRSPRTPKGKRTPNKPLRQSPRFFGSPSRRLHGLTTPTKSGTRETVSNNHKGVKRLREMNSGEVRTRPSIHVQQSDCPAFPIIEVPATQTLASARKLRSADDASDEIAMSKEKAPPSFAKRKEVSTSDIDDVTPERTFSLMSYNVLADCHIQPTTYPYRDPAHLHIDTRHKSLLEELRYSNCDVICLQEVGPRYYQDTLNPEMQKLGYDGVYSKRTFDKNDEGCATFYNTSKFTLKDNVAYRLGEIAFKLLSDDQEETNHFSRYIDRCDVALLSLLEHVTSGRTVVVCNTHLVWESAHISDVRCIQAFCCLVAIREFQRKHTGSNITILCGDFNTEPCEAAYELIVSGNIVDENKKKIQAENHIKGDEPRITNLDADFCCCLDYIFYTGPPDSSQRHGFGVISVLDFLSEEEMRLNLPPSEFVWKPFKRKSIFYQNYNVSLKLVVNSMDKSSVSKDGISKIQDTRGALVFCK
uniref:Glucose-repressible alcohol dehydrogenase transcriptional effector n=1 Tax=Magallana gigas TaxID=29159 RepID=K1R0V0_MAGGI